MLFIENQSSHPLCTTYWQFVLGKEGRWYSIFHGESNKKSTWWPTYWHKYWEKNGDGIQFFMENQSSHPLWTIYWQLYWEKKGDGIQCFIENQHAHPLGKSYWYLYYSFVDNKGDGIRFFMDRLYPRSSCGTSKPTMLLDFIVFSTHSTQLQVAKYNNNRIKRSYPWQNDQVCA